MSLCAADLKWNLHDARTEDMKNIYTIRMFFLFYFSAIHFIGLNIIQCQAYRSNYQAKHEPSSSADTELTDNVCAVRTTGATFVCVYHVVCEQRALNTHRKWWALLDMSVENCKAFWVDFSTCSHNDFSLLISDVRRTAHTHLVIPYQDSVYLCLSCIQMQRAIQWICSTVPGFYCNGFSNLNQRSSQ